MGQLVAHGVVPVEVVAVVNWAIAHAESGGEREGGGGKSEHTYADRQTDTHVCTNRQTTIGPT